MSVIATIVGGVIEYCAVRLGLSLTSLPPIGTS